MTAVRTSLTIAASPERVWSVLTDFAAYPAWTSIISNVRTDLREGASFRFRIQIEAAPALAFSAKIVRCAPGRELSWRGGVPLVPALAHGHHYFRLAPVGDATEITHGEDFGGLLDLAVRGSVHARITRTYDAFNHALRARVEAGAA